MAHQIAHRLQALSSAIHRTFVQHFTRFQLTLCSRGFSVLAELLYQSVIEFRLLISVCEASQ